MWFGIDWGASHIVYVLGYFDFNDPMIRIPGIILLSIIAVGAVCALPNKSLTIFIRIFVTAVVFRAAIFAYLTPRANSVIPFYILTAFTVFCFLAVLVEAIKNIVQLLLRVIRKEELVRSVPLYVKKRSFLDMLKK